MLKLDVQEFANRLKGMADSAGALANESTGSVFSHIYYSAQQVTLLQVMTALIQSTEEE